MNPSPEEEKIERLRNAMYSRSLSPQLRERDRRTLKPEREVVGSDWKREEPELGSTLVAPRYIGWIRRILWWFLTAAAVFFVGAVFFFIYYFTLGGGSLSSTPSNIDIAVSGPATVAGGEPTELQIAVTNKNRSALELTRLVITYPDGTRSAADYKTAEPSMAQDLGTIDPGATRQGTVTAVFSGIEGQHENVKVELQYHLNGSSAIFVASSDYDLSFSSSPLSISIDGNTQAISGQPILLNVTVSSNSRAPIKDALLHVDYPFGFKLTSATPPSVANNLWALGDLVPGDKRVVTLMGTLSGETNDVRVFNFTAGTRDNASSTEISTPLASNTLTTSISKSFLGLTMSVNGASGSNVIVTPGSDVTVNVAYQNNLTTLITDAIVVAKLTGVELDGSTVTSVDGFYRSSDDSIIWNKTTTGGVLASLAAGDKGILTFSFKVPTSDMLKNVTNPHINITLNAAGSRVDSSGTPSSLQSTINQPIVIASDLKLAANGLYYSSPYGSSGPMPPKANLETTYAMVFTLTNTTNKIDNAEVTATLPPYVRWTGKNSPASENLTFNQDTGMVTWHVGTVDPNVGLNGVPPRQVGFEIGFTPSASQIGQQPVLLNNIQLTGTDDATGQPVTADAGNVTTDILGDLNFNESNATVIK